MLIVLGLYFGIVWLLFFKLRLLPWNGASKAVVWTGALVIALVVIGALNHTTPTGRVSVQGVVTNIVPNVAGRVTEVVVEAGAEVKEGDVLFRIDDTVYAAEVARLEASLESARAGADQLLLDLDAAEAEIESLNAQLTFGIQRRDDIVRLEDRGASTTFQLQEAPDGSGPAVHLVRRERRLTALLDGCGICKAGSFALAANGGMVGIAAAGAARGIGQIGLDPVI